MPNAPTIYAGLAAARWFSRAWTRPHWRIIYFHGVERHQINRFVDLLDHFSEMFTWVAYSQGLECLRSGTMRVPAMTLTFDDADLSVYENVFPILAQRGIAACIFAVPTYLDAGVTLREAVRRPVMSWEQLADCVARGMEVGCHTYSHENLRRAPDGRIVEEVVRAKEALEDRLGIPVRDFAYPYGQFDGRTLRVVGGIAGIRSQATSHRGGMDPGKRYPFIRRDRCDLSRTPHENEFIMRLADRFYGFRRFRNWLREWKRRSEQ